MKFQVSEGEKYEKIMEVEIPVEELELPIKFACKRLAEKVNIPGFRKGKAPRSVLESFVGIDAILEEMADDMLGKAYVEGLKETGLEPVAQPRVEMVELAQDKPMRFKAFITVKPEVKLGQYKGLAVTRRIIEVNDEDITRDLEQQRQRMSKLVDAEEGYAAANGDVVTINFRGLKDGQAFDGGTAENYPLELGSNTFIPGFEPQLVGCKLGEERNIDVTFPADYQEPKLAGQPVVFEVKVNEIKRKVLPELDQEFIEEVSETAENLDQLKDEVRARLTEESMNMANENTRSAAVFEAVEKAEVDVPPVMIEQELDQLVHDTAQRMQAQGLNLDQYLQYTGGTMETLRENYRARAELAVKRDLVMEAVAAAEDIPVSEQEIADEIKQMAVNYWQPEEKIREALEKNNRMDDLSQSIRLQKAAQLIYDQAEISDEIVDRNQLMQQAKDKAAAEQAAREALSDAEPGLYVAEEADISEGADADGEVVEAEVKETE